MTTENFTAFIRHFIKSTKCSKEHPVLLILDNHDAHISIETVDLAKNNGVVMLTLPPHCSHKLQPLDRSVYGPFKAFYNQAANAFMINHPGQPITIHNISQLIDHAYPLAFTPKNISAGFSVSGIYPFNPDVFSDEDFLSSYVTDRQLVEDDVPSIAAGPSVEAPEQNRPTQHPARHSLSPTSSDSDQCIVAPEVISPFPKAAPRKHKGGRKKGKTLVLTDTPIKEQIRATDEERKRKKDKQQASQKAKVESKSRKKLKLQPDDEVAKENTSSDEDDDDAVFSVDDESDDEPEQTQLEDMELPNANALNKNDFVLIKFATKNTVVGIMYVGQILARTEDTDESTFEVKFMLREKPKSFTFIYPIVEDISEVSFEDVVGKLPNPIQHGDTARVARHMVFPVDLSYYSDVLR